MIVAGTRSETEQGRYMGEEGVGYAFGAPAHPGDISRATRGRLQGGDYPCRIEILVPGAEVVETELGHFLVVPEGTRCAEGYPVSGPLDAQEAIDRGLARVEVG